MDSPLAMPNRAAGAGAEEGAEAGVAEAFLTVSASPGASMDAAAGESVTASNQPSRPMLQSSPALANLPRSSSCSGSR